LSNLGAHIGLPEALLEPSWAILDAPTTSETSRPGPVEGVGGGVNPSPKGKKGGWKRKLPKPPTPRGLVGLRGAQVVTTSCGAQVFAHRFAPRVLTNRAAKNPADGVNKSSGQEHRRRSSQIVRRPACGLHKSCGYKPSARFVDPQGGPPKAPVAWSTWRRHVTWTHPSHGPRPHMEPPVVYGWVFRQVTLFFFCLVAGRFLSALLG
jgi:hypothetical protein